MEHAHASSLRMIALASAVALAVVLPMAVARAGSAESGRRPPSPGQTPEDARANGGSGLLTSLDGTSGLDLSQVAGAQEESAACGPQLASSAGVEAQTCVMSEGPDTWGRTYYRNETSGPLTGALTLTRPDDSTVEVECVLEPSGEPRVCETPREPTLLAGRRSRPYPYSAVAEIASADGRRMLLRTGSES